MKHRPLGPTLTFSTTLALALGLLSSPASAFHESAVHVEAGADIDLRGPYASLTLAF